MSSLIGSGPEAHGMMGSWARSLSWVNCRACARRWTCWRTAANRVGGRQSRASRAKKCLRRAHRRNRRELKPTSSRIESPQLAAGRMPPTSGAVQQRSIRRAPPASRGNPSRSGGGARRIERSCSATQTAQNPCRQRTLPMSDQTVQERIAEARASGSTSLDLAHWTSRNSP